MTKKEIIEKIEETLRELEDYPQEEITEQIDLCVEQWTNCTREEAIFLMGFEKGLECALN